jgi:hypothetical protein
MLCCPSKPKLIIFSEKDEASLQYENMKEKYEAQFDSQVTKISISSEETIKSFKTGFPMNFECQDMNTKRGKL